MHTVIPMSQLVCDGGEGFLRVIRPQNDIGEELRVDERCTRSYSPCTRFPCSHNRPCEHGQCMKHIRRQAHASPSLIWTRPDVSFAKVR
jgi:hypothetical protein